MKRLGQKHNLSFTDQVAQFAVTYLQAAVTGLHLPDILGKKDWGECTATHLQMRALKGSLRG